MSEYKVAMQQQTENRIQLIDRIPLSTPLSMQIELASACNFKCRFCMHYNDQNIKKGVFKPGIMSLATFKSAVDGLKQFPDKLKFITLQSRGESLLNPHFVEMLRYLKEADVVEKVGLYTNGTLLSKEVSDGMIDAGLDTLHISIEGINAEEYKRVAGVDIDFEQLIQNITYFYENKKNTYVYIKTIDCGMSSKDKDKFKLLFNHICDDLFIENAIDAWQGAGSDKTYLTDNRYNESVTKAVICPRLFFTCDIHFDGSVVACGHDWSEQYIVGNINSDTIANIWGNEKFEHIRNIHLAGDADKIERCRNCVSRTECLPKDNIDRLLEDRK